jgi:hypothetical protein
VPLTKLQSHVLRILAAHRSPDSYIAGGVALNRDGPRFSNDIDIFQDSEDRMAAAAGEDVTALEAAGLKLTQAHNKPGKREVVIEGLGESMVLEWVVDSDYRFFPAMKDDTFGYVLHPVDLAANKASAAADRREPRDVLDLVTIHETILPLGAVICAAVGKFPGATPEEMLAEIRRHSRFTAEEFRVLATVQPIDPAALHRHIRAMLEDAERFIEKVPSKDVGVVFLEGGKAVQPDINALDKYERHSGARRGIWPSSSGIESAMMEHYKNPRP